MSARPFLFPLVEAPAVERPCLALKLEQHGVIDGTTASIAATWAARCEKLYLHPSNYFDDFISSQGTA